MGIRMWLPMSLMSGRSIGKMFVSFRNWLSCHEQKADENELDFVTSALGPSHSRMTFGARRTLRTVVSRRRNHENVLFFLKSDYLAHCAWSGPTAAWKSSQASSARAHAWF